MSHALLGYAGCVCCFVTGVIAQPYYAAEPQFFSFELEPSGSTGYVHDDQFTSMIRVQLSWGGAGTTPAAAAADAASKIAARIQDGTLDPARVSILLQNFGGFDTYLASEDAAFTLFSGEDRVDELSGSGHSSFLAAYGGWQNYQPWMQPWMEHSAGKVDPTTGQFKSDYESGQYVGGAARKWMQEFCDALDADLESAGYNGITYPRIVPARFHMDIERSIVQFDTSAQIRLMMNCEADERWDEVPVPGWAGKTLAELWDEAKATYGWGNSSTTLASVLNSSQNGQYGQNQPYVRWWHMVCERAREAAIQHIVYDVVKEHWSQSPPLCSNFDSMKADMLLEDEAWRISIIEGRTSSASVNQEYTPMFRRGNLERAQQGSFPYFLTQPSVANPPLMWGMYAQSCFGDFSAPSLYRTRPDSVEVPENMLQLRTYVAEDGFGEAPLESWQDYNDRWFRHQLDTATASVGSPGETAPWVDITGERVIECDGSDATDDLCIYGVPTYEDIEGTRHTLALCRSKGIAEILMFGRKPAGGVGVKAQWETFIRASRQVFTNSYHPYQVVRGTDLQPELNGHPSCIMSTLRDGVREAQIAGEHIPGTDTDVTEFLVTLDDIDPIALGDAGHIMIECSVAPVDAGEVIETFGSLESWSRGVRGTILIWRQGSQEWAPVETINDSGDKGIYGFYTPDGTTRREWDIGLQDGLCNLLSDPDNCDGALYIKLVHIAPKTASGFVSRYDLVQVYQIDSQLSMMSLRSGSNVPLITVDYNYDGLQNSDDCDLFLDDWEVGNRGADYNADGEVNATDLAQFLAAFSRATSSGSGTSEE